jgi:hypothetical protein
MSKNTLNQLTPEAKQTIIGWIDDDPHRGPGKALAVTRVRNQFHIEASQAELVEFHFDWHFQQVLEASNITPENRPQLLKALKGLGQHHARLQAAAFNLLNVLAMKSGDPRLLGQIVKLNMKSRDLELRQSIHERNKQQAATKGNKTGTANLPMDSSLGALASLSASPAPTSPLPLPPYHLAPRPWLLSP